MLEILPDRSVLEITGDDRHKFLQGLITNNINKATENNLIYSAMLNSQGRFLYDFFIFSDGEKLMFDCLTSRRDEILQKLNFYKLRSKVVITKNDDLKVFYSQNSGKNGKEFSDPRHPNLGFRIYNNLTNNHLPLTTYHLNRLSLKIAESEYDLTYEKSFILEFGFDNLNAIDYQKGCYVGQELTARTHYRGEIRKKIFHIKIASQNAIEKNSEITCEAKPAGIILSSYRKASDLHALALIKLPQDIDFEDFAKKLCCEGNKIFILD